jgi:hypothetical protein
MLTQRKEATAAHASPSATQPISPLNSAGAGEDAGLWRCPAGSRQAEEAVDDIEVPIRNHVAICALAIANVILVLCRTAGAGNSVCLRIEYRGYRRRTPGFGIVLPAVALELGSFNIGHRLSCQVRPLILFVA